MNELTLANRAADWHRLKALVLDSVSSPITKRVYNLGLDEFIAWYGQEPRPGFTKATVAAWRVALEARGLGSVSINVRITAVRKLAVEAADNGLLAPELANGITRVKGVASKGVRLGNWLSLKQAQALLNAPDTTTTKGLRDRAIIAVLLGCGLRRSEVAALTMGHIQQRDGRWCIVDLVGKHGRVRTVPMPTWVKVAIDTWTNPVRVVDGYVFRSVNRGGQVQGNVLSEKMVWQMLRPYAAAAAEQTEIGEVLRRDDSNLHEWLSMAQCCSGIAQGCPGTDADGTPAGHKRGGEVRSENPLIAPRKEPLYSGLSQTVHSEEDRAMSAVTRNVLRNWSRRRYRGDSQVLSEWEVLGAEYWRAAEPERDPEAISDQPYTETRNTFREIQARWQESGAPKEGTLSEEYRAAELAFRKVVIGRLHQHPRTALCFSGGGIRSATFGLGVLQGMAAHSCPEDAPASSPPLLLGELNYLSTVSGGGYLGGWFSSWASRHPLGSAGVIQELSSVPEAAWEPEPAPLRHLRKFASYLNPQLGAFSADTWTLAATVLRNVVLNWLVLLPLLAAVLVLPRLLYALVWTYPMIDNDYLLLASAALLAASVAYMVLDLPSAGNARFCQRRFLIFGLAPILLSGIGFSLYWAWQGDLGAEPSVLGFVQYGILIMAAGVIIGMPLARWRRHAFSPKWMVQGAAFAVIAGAVGGVFCDWMTKSFTNPNGGDLYNEQLYTWLALPALLGVLALAQGMLVALTSTITSDEDREWWARAMAWIFISTVCCFSFSGMAIMAPNLAHYLPSLKWQSLATAAAGLLASRIGFSPKTPATAAKAETARAESLSQITLRLVPRLILPVLALLLVTLVATFNQAASLQVTDWLRNLPQWSSFPALGIPTDRPSVTVELALMALLAVPPLVLARIIDANKFSLHAMYRARLIRTFLGASHNGRKPNPFTGFDPDDNVPMAKLPAKPLHVVNATLNLVKSDNLAWQERKAESFTATPYHTGSCRLGYQLSTAYFGNVTLGGAITVSGAAANPNMGYASSPVLSVVMMLFNARLGVWAPNPGEPGRGRWHKTGPTYSIRPFVDEAFGLTSDKNAWVNLSDGGHFENLGLYEMVLRRCRTIIVVDGSADPEFHFGDLGNAVRKIRIDMGIPIEFPDGISIGKQITEKSKHWAVGTIGYQDVDGEGVENGVLLYLKASLTGNEPRDVKNYADQNTAFPHQSTADQWFDESQFESYRRLGYHAIEEVFGPHRGVCSLEDFASSVRSYCTGREPTAAARAV